MNQSFYIGAIGAQQHQQRMNVQANNIANVNTYGYKSSSGRFSALMYENMRGIDNAQLPAGAGTGLQMTSTNFQAGPVATTGRAQDYMINGDGFFALIDLATDEITYTRNGAFTVAERLEPSDMLNENGEPIMEKVLYLSDGEGRFVLSRQGGLVEVTDPEAELPVGIFDYENYDGMEHLGGTRYAPVGKNGDLWLGDGTLVSGALELSNVDLAEEFTKVIESQRAYSMALKMLQTSDEIETTINGLRG